MWDDFSVGSVGNSTSALRVMETNLSHCDDAYWWNSRDLGIGGKVAKDTEEGREIAALIETAPTEKKVDALLFRIGVASMSPRKIVRVLHQARATAFRAGEEHRASLIREVLDCRR